MEDRVLGRRSCRFRELWIFGFKGGYCLSLDITWMYSKPGESKKLKKKKKVFEMKWVKEKAENEMIHIRLSINISLNEWMNIDEHINEWHKNHASSENKDNWVVLDLNVR